MGRQENRELPQELQGSWQSYAGEQGQVERQEGRELPLELQGKLTEL